LAGPLSGAACAPDSGYARALVAKVKPAFVHIHSDEKGLPRVAAIWSVEGLDGGELMLQEVDTGAPVASELLAET
jgi:hypothetical protein